MNERLWYEAPDPHGLYDLAAEHISARKTRLFAVACCRMLGVGNDVAREALEIGERLADENASFVMLREVILQLERCKASPVDDDTEALRVALFHPAVADIYYRQNQNIITYAPAAFSNTQDYALIASYYAAHAAARLFVEATAAIDERIMGRVFLEQAQMLRGFVGNPFRRDGVALQTLAAEHPRLRLLAADIYTHKTFDRLPELASLYSDFGADRRAIPVESLAPRAHHRGNWLVDTALGWR